MAEKARGRVAVPGRKDHRHKVHYVGVYSDAVPRVGERFPLEAGARTVCSPHQFATGWERVDYGLPDDEWCSRDL